MANKNKGSVKFNKGFVKHNNKNVETFADALALEALCNCGIDCCYGILTLPNWVSATGERQDFALAIIDGAVVVDEKQLVIDQIKAIQNA